MPAASAVCPPTRPKPRNPRYDPRRHPVNVSRIYQMECSVREPILKAITVERNRSPLTVSLTPSMLSSKARIKKKDVDLKERPCLVTSIRGEEPSIVPFATFEGQPITKLDLHTQHWAVAVGATPAWPEGRSTIPISPDWPESHEKPVYALVKEIPVGDRRFGGLYEYWPRDERGYRLQRADGTKVVQRNFKLTGKTIADFDRLTHQIQREYEALTPEQRTVWNASWDEAERRRKLANAEKAAQLLQGVAQSSITSQMSRFTAPPAVRGVVPPRLQPTTPLAPLVLPNKTTAAQTDTPVPTSPTSPTAQGVGSKKKKRTSLLSIGLSMGTRT